jgi:hypothetical protein
MRIVLIEVTQAQDDGTTLPAYINTDYIVAISTTTAAGVANVFLSSGVAMQVTIPEDGLRTLARQLGWSPQTHPSSGQ